MSLIIAAFALLSAMGCGGSSDDSTGERTQVVASFYPLAWAAERIGGTAVEVRNLTPPGAEPHDLEPSAREIEAIRSADVVLYLGDGFQPGVERAVDGASGTIIDVLQGQQLRPAEGDETAEDPHVWLDPVRLAAIVERIGTALGRPAEAARVATDLRGLDAEYERGLASCRRHDIVTSHAAFGYLARRYGLRQIALTGVSPEAEPSARDLERVVDQVRESGATTVFFETLVSPRLAETVAREAGARTAVLDPIEGLSDAEIAQGADYLSVMRENLSALRRALACT
jgi:zinc transport system substrate-binding protein